MWAEELVGLANKIALRQYRSALERMRKELLKEGTRTPLNGLEKSWANAISGWISDFDSLDSTDTESLLRHVQRTRKAFGGMGSLNDVASTDGTSLDRDRESLFKLCNKLISQYQ